MYSENRIYFIVGVWHKLLMLCTHVVEDWFALGPQYYTPFRHSSFFFKENIYGNAELLWMVVYMIGYSFYFRRSQEEFYFLVV